MLLIFGVRSRFHTVGTGTFFCPRCNADRTYVLRGVRRWFTLFFLPIFPVSSATSRHVHCTTCESNFAESALNLPTTDALRALLGQSFLQCAVAVLKSGDPASSLARECAAREINERLGPEAPIDDATLDARLAEADPSQLAVYAAPVAQRLSDRATEQFFAGCATIALADGPLSAGERDALRNLGESLNLSAAHQRGVVETLRAPAEAPLDPGETA